MSVYTKLTQAEIEDFLNQYDVGQLQQFSGIKEGVTNTIYHIKTSKGEFILTLFEALTPEKLPFYTELTAFLAEHGLPCQKTLFTADKETILSLKSKPAILLEYLPGKTLRSLTTSHCRQIGTTLAKLHLAALNFPKPQANPRDLAWCVNTAATLTSYLDNEENRLLQQELEYHQQYQFELPQGIIHADLFPDNVLFENDQLSGLIDFYYAGKDSLVYDLAVCAIACCRQANFTLDPELTQSLIRAYQSIRPLTKNEIQAWPIMLRQAALRFWLSRLLDFHLRQRDELVQVKNPDEYKTMLNFLQNIPKALLP